MWALSFNLTTFPLLLLSFIIFSFLKRPKQDFLFALIPTSINFLGQFPTPPKSWKTEFFFVKSASPFSWFSSWQVELPSLPELGIFKDLCDYKKVVETLKCLHFNINHMLEESSSPCPLSNPLPMGPSPNTGKDILLYDFGKRKINKNGLLLSLDKEMWRASISKHIN